MNKTYTDNRGFTRSSHDHLTHDAHSKGYRPEVIQRGKKAYAYLCYIPWDNVSHTLVYFVTGNTGKEHGQFPTAEAAIQKLKDVESKE